MIKILGMPTHFWQHYIQWFNFLVNFVTNKVFKTFFTERNLVRYNYFINIYIVYINWMLKSVECKLFNLYTTKSQLFLLIFSITYNNEKTKLFFRVTLFDILLIFVYLIFPYSLLYIIFSLDNCMF